MFVKGAEGRIWFYGGEGKKHILIGTVNPLEQDSIVRELNSYIPTSLFPKQDKEIIRICIDKYNKFYRKNKRSRMETKKEKLEQLLQELERGSASDQVDTIAEVLALVAEDSPWRKEIDKIVDYWNSIDWDWYPNG